MLCIFLDINTYTILSFSSAEKEPNYLILSDLYYHLQGELEGRKIGAGPFKELSQFLIESNVFQTYQHKYDDNLFLTGKDAYLFDLKRVRADLGLDLWDYSKWKESKAIADTLLHHMKDVNSMVFLTSSKLSALRALRSVSTVYLDDVSSKVFVSVVLSLLSGVPFCCFLFQRSDISYQRSTLFSCISDAY